MTLYPHHTTMERQSPPLPNRPFSRTSLRKLTPLWMGCAVGLLAACSPSITCGSGPKISHNVQRGQGLPAVSVAPVAIQDGDFGCEMKVKAPNGYNILDISPASAIELEWNGTKRSTDVSFLPGVPLREVPQSWRIVSLPTLNDKNTVRTMQGKLRFFLRKQGPVHLYPLGAPRSGTHHLCVDGYRVRLRLKQYRTAASWVISSPVPLTDIQVLQDGKPMEINWVHQSEPVLNFSDVKGCIYNDYYYHFFVMTRKDGGEPQLRLQACSGPVYAKTQAVRVRIQKEKK